MASPFKQVKGGKKPPVKGPSKGGDAKKKKKVKYTQATGGGGGGKGTPKAHASVAVDKATGGPAKRAIANAISGRTSHSKAKGALSIHPGEGETESLYG